MTNGITVTQTGVDVEKALDSQKILDSRWKYFEMIFEKQLTLSKIDGTTGVSVEVFKHNLGFVPAFTCYNASTGAYIGGDTTGGLRADNTRIYFDGFFLDTGMTNATILLRIYNVSIITEYTAPIDKTLPVNSSIPSRNGVKITELPNGMGQNELSTFNLNTRAKTLAIQKSGTAIANNASGFLVIITHNLGYPPTYLTAQVDPNLTYSMPITIDFVPVIASADTTTITLRGAQASLLGTYSYVIFKELADFAI